MPMDKIKILWADDEIEVLEPHVLFLRSKGYSVYTVTNGDDAIAKIRESFFDIVLLDESMPGKDGLTTLYEIKSRTHSSSSLFWWTLCGS